jgi:hypothetical protein
LPIILSRAFSCAQVESMKKPPPDAVGELIARGLLADTPAPVRRDGSNSDRARVAESHWTATLPTGQPVKLTCATDLQHRAEAHRAFTRACPSVVPWLHFHEKTEHGEVIAEEFVSGIALETAWDNATLSRQEVSGAFGALHRALESSTTSSTTEARSEEWRQFTRKFLALTSWAEIQRRSLENEVLPQLFTCLCQEPPRRRWSNGDFWSGNILFDSSSGTARLVDLEHARCTHFFQEDAVRFRVLSPCARRNPGALAALSNPGAAWHLYFWMRQLLLEEQTNSTAYLDCWRPQRLATIRCLSEGLLGRELTEWPTPADRPAFHVEDRRWHPQGGLRVQIKGWCVTPETPLRAIVATTAQHVLHEAAPQARPDVRTHFGGAETALQSGFEADVSVNDIESAFTLAAGTADGRLLPFTTVQPSQLPGRGPAVSGYTRWASLHDPDPALPQLAEAQQGPLFSILLPIYRTPPEFLRACLASVRAQHYSRWELCVVDDGSQQSGLSEVLEHERSDPRVRVIRREQNGGISRATNDALAAARGDFVVFLDHDDVLRPHALARLAATLKEQPTLDAVYSDEDKLSSAGERVLPFFKPSFSPEFLLRAMYIGHVLCVRTSIARAAGGCDPAFDGIQDYEFFLRVTEHTRRIGHLPEVLYHW